MFQAFSSVVFLINKETWKAAIIPSSTESNHLEKINWMLVYRIHKQVKLLLDLILKTKIKIIKYIKYLKF